MKTPARKLSLVLYLSSCVGLCLWAPPSYAGEPAAGAGEPAAGAGEPEAGAEASASLDGASMMEADPNPDTSALPWKLRVGIVAQTQNRGRTDFPWIKRWAPERMMTEIGVFGGMFFPAQNHDFYNPDSGHKPLWIVNGEAGLRLAFFPERYIGVEVEGAGIIARARTSTNDIAPLWAVRGHVIAQLPWWSVTPFVLVGAGAMGASSHPLILGKDVDPAVRGNSSIRRRLSTRV